MKVKFLSLASMMLGYSAMVAAGTMGAPVTVAWQPFVGVGIGPVWPNNNHSHNIRCGCNIDKTYTATGKNQTLIGGELFYGWGRLLRPQLSAQLSLGVAATSAATMQGGILEVQNNPAFHGLNYSYKVYNTRVVAKAGLSYDTGYGFSVYADNSMGVGFNRAYDYQLTAIEEWAVPINGFTRKTTTVFVDTVGVGIQKNINRFIVGVGYEFGYLGDYTLASTTGGNDLTNTLYTNMLKFTLAAQI